MHSKPGSIISIDSRAKRPPLPISNPSEASACALAIHRSVLSGLFFQRRGLVCRHHSSSGGATSLHLLFCCRHPPASIMCTHVVRTTQFSCYSRLAPNTRYPHGHEACTAPASGVSSALLCHADYSAGQ